MRAMRDGEAFAGTNPMKYTKWLPTAEFADLLIRLREEGVEGRPPSLGLRGSLKTALIRMRHNIVQAVIGEQLGVSQPTVSRAIGGHDRGDHPGPEGHAAHGRGGARGL